MESKVIHSGSIFIIATLRRSRSRSMRVCRSLLSVFEKNLINVTSCASSVIGLKNRMATSSSCFYRPQIPKGFKGTTYTWTGSLRSRGRNTIVGFWRMPRGTRRSLASDVRRDSFQTIVPLGPIAHQSVPTRFQRNLVLNGRIMTARCVADWTTGRFRGRIGSRDVAVVNAGRLSGRGHWRSWAAGPLTMMLGS